MVSAKFVNLKKKPPPSVVAIHYKLLCSPGCGNFTSDWLSARCITIVHNSGWWLGRRSPQPIEWCLLAAVAGSCCAWQRVIVDAALHHFLTNFCEIFSFPKSSFPILFFILTVCVNEKFNIELFL